jgi:hypothetical protein
MRIRAEKDFWSGVMFLAFAVVGAAAARGYSLGSAGRMGPGYFPLLLAGVLGVLGLLLVARALVAEGEALARANLVPLLTIAVAVALFGVTIEPLGLVISILLLTILVTLAARQSGVPEMLALAAALTMFSVGIFVFVLRLPLSLWPNF